MKSRFHTAFYFSVVPRAGLEPARITPHAPQTCAATNYATSAIFPKTYLFAGGSFWTGIATVLLFDVFAAGVAAGILTTVALLLASAGMTTC